MQTKRIKIIYFSVTDSGAKELELSWRKFISVIGLAFLVLLFLAATTVALFTDFYQNAENASLAKLNNVLNQQLTEIGSKVNKIESRINVLEDHDDELRLIADLPRIDSDTRDVGVGGFQQVNQEVAIFSSDLQNDVLQYRQVLDKVERRLELAKASRDEVEVKLEEDKKKLKHTPSIRPLIDGTIKDRFGLRIDPLIEKIKHHDGVDITAERGTEVLATAAGVVEKVVTRYKINRSWGKYIVINHGFGISTLYGHLSTILVRQGQQVDRRKPMGLVGDTGRATGPHLHYEVIQQGTRQDPLQFILN